MSSSQRPPNSPGSEGDGSPDDGTPTIIEQTFTPPALNPVNGSGLIFGTAGADQITGSNNVDTIDAMGGNDFVYAFGGDDIIIAGHGEGDDYYDGGAGSDDTIRFWSALADQPLTFHLGGFGDPNTVEGAVNGVGSDIFTNIERIESGAGNDVFYIHGHTNWHIDAGAGIDTVALVGELDITEQTDGPDISHLEIIDLNTTGSNTIDFDAEGAFDSIEGNDTGYLQIKGTSADRVNLTNDGQNYQGGVWRLADEGELTELGGVQYFHYVFNDGDAEANVYIQAGIEVDGVGATVEDRFNSQAYDLNDGSNDWATNWTESNDDFSSVNGSPTDGEIFISHDPTTSSGNFQLTLTDKDAELDGADTIQRSVDLTGASSATLTFDYRRVDMENDDAIQIYAWNGENFVLIGEIEGNGLDDQAYQTFTFDLTSFISANTIIQFAVDDRLEDGDTLYIDNVKITYLADETPPPVAKMRSQRRRYKIESTGAERQRASRFRQRTHGTFTSRLTASDTADDHGRNDAPTDRRSTERPKSGSDGNTRLSRHAAQNDATFHGSATSTCTSFNGRGTASAGTRNGAGGNECAISRR